MTKMYKIWQILYPVGIYYVVSSMVYFVLARVLGETKESYMLRQLLCAAATIPFVYSFYRQDRDMEEIVYGKKKLTLSLDTIKGALLSIVLAVLLGIGVNNAIAMTPLIQMSTGFAEANDSFFAGDMLYELLGSCLLIPIAEELLYRGVVYKRFRVLAGTVPAMVLSGALFGLMHFNLVQFLYAGALGILLAFLLERTGFLYAPILGHIAANVVAVMRQETGWLSFSYELDAAGIGFTAALLLVAGILVGCSVWGDRREGQRETS